MTENEYHESLKPHDDSFDSKPRARIQWKGTDVCMDVLCSCGEDGHIDGMFAYNYKCLACGRGWILGFNVGLTEMTSEQFAHVDAGGACGFKTADDLYQPGEYKGSK